MSNYKPFRVPGGTYFFCLRLQDPKSNLLLREVDLLRMAFRVTMHHKPFVLSDVVILPAQVLMIAKLPDEDADYSGRLGMLKSVFFRHLPEPTEARPIQCKHGEKGIWQRRIEGHVLRDGEDYEWHRAHVLSAPVREELVARPEHWPHSSIHRDGGLTGAADHLGGVVAAAE